tara:strand:- start:69301 stop:69933 length:633 start_codon:yes stop_codon:yes gene_type:complete
MELTYLLLKAFLVGFIIAVPIGSVGILCINRALHHGFKPAFITGLGAAIGDTLFGALAAFGLTTVAQVITTEQIWIRVVGGLIIIYAGYKTFNQKSLHRRPHMPHNRYTSNLLSSIAMTITNPITIFAFIAIFAAVGLGSQKLSYDTTAFIVLAIFTGSLTWWFSLSFGMSFLRGKFTNNTLVWINKISAIILLLFGLVAIVAGLQKLWG